MPRGTPFHSRTSALCESYAWRNWSGYVCASSYSLVPEMEYHAIRNSAALIDVSPLFKYRITGADAARLVNRVVTRDARGCKTGQILYTPWCDDHGKTVDDGTVWNLGDGAWRMTSAESNFRWLEESAFGMDAQVEDVSEDIAALALQGPLSKAILQAACDGAVDKLRFYRFIKTKLDGVPVMISRTGYTGDLGYEIWTDAGKAEKLWDAITGHGKGYGLTPAGLLALDISRIEAGFILAEVDYTPSRKALIESQSYSPFELSLDWTVSLAKGPFTGRKALVEEQRRGTPRRIVGLEVDWSVVEKYYQKMDLPPEPPHLAWRSKIPVYAGLRQIGIATSGVWSPLLKRYIVLATVESPFAQVGSVVEIEVTLEGERKRAPATVVKRPFFDPPRKKA
ncbi:MAG: aminomethyltransferase family protein [Thermoplasmata archaeon]